MLLAGPLLAGSDAIPAVNAGIALLIAVFVAGIGFFVLHKRYRQRQQREAQRRQQHPNEPWQWRDNWVSGQIKSQAGKGAWTLVVFVVALNLIAWMCFANLLLKERETLSPEAWLVALLPVAGAAAAWQARLKWLQMRHWDASLFEMSSTPGSLGGVLTGVVRTPHPLAELSGITLHLACLRIIPGSGGEGPDSYETVWELEKTLRADVGVIDGHGAVVPVHLLLPRELPPSGSGVRWMLKVHAPMQSNESIAEFEVPVFATAVASGGAPQTKPISSLYATPPALSEVVARMGGVLLDDPSGVSVIKFPVARNRGRIATLAGLGAVAAAISCWLAVHSSDYDLQWIAAAVVTLLLVLAAFASLNSARIEFGPQGLAFRRVLLGIGPRRKLESEQISRLRAKLPSQSTTLMLGYHLVVETTAGDEHTVIGNIRRRKDADRLAREIAKGVGVAFSLGDGLCTRRG